jgi:CelD/BcsL family acetyltransferase involved in cellulose biosynthesis
MSADTALGQPIAAPGVTQAATAADSLVISIHTDLAEVESAWRAFEKTADRTVFQTFDWLAAWQREIGAIRGVSPAIVIGHDKTGAIQFIFPMAVQQRRLVRRLTFLGSELCDYNGPLLAPGFAANLTDESFRRLWRAISRRLRRDSRSRFHLYDLEKMPQTIGTRRNPFRALGVRANPSRAYIATLGRDWDAYYAERRSAATRKTERKQAKRLAECGEITLVEPQESSERVAVIDALIAQKRRALARMGADDIFDRPGYVAFYRAVAASDRLRGMLRISRLAVGSETGAAGIALLDRGTLSLILSSYHDGVLAQHGPGRTLLNALLRSAIEAGIRDFDFTIGDEPYKRDWCDREVALYDFTAAASLRAIPVTLALTAYRLAKRMVKQSPALWHVFSRIRARLG